MSYNPPPPEAIRNIIPQGRISQQKDKDTIEKSRLKERQSGFVRYDSDIIDQPFKISEISNLYMKDSERFHTDVSGEEKRYRDLCYNKNKLIEEYKRTDKINRDELKWKNEIEKYDMEIAKWEQIRSDSTNLKAKRNIGSMPCDPITLEYNTSVDGSLLKYSDDLIKYRSSARTEVLRSHMNGTHNPITGEELPVPKKIDPPTNPQPNVSKQFH